MQENVKLKVLDSLKTILVGVVVRESQGALKFSCSYIGGDSLNKLSALVINYSVNWIIKRSGKGITVIIN